MSCTLRESNKYHDIVLLVAFDTEAVSLHRNRYSVVSASVFRDCLSHYHQQFFVAFGPIVVEDLCAVFDFVVGYEPKAS